MAHDSAEHGHHGPDLETYYKVFGALIVLTMITIGVGQVTFLPGGVTLFLTLFISTVKATLVCRYFMLLGYADKFYSFILVLSLIFLGLMLLITAIDWSTRSEVNPDLEDYHTSVYLDSHHG